MANQLSRTLIQPVLQTGGRLSSSCSGWLRLTPLFDDCAGVLVEKAVSEMAASLLLKSAHRQRATFALPTAYRKRVRSSFPTTTARESALRVNTGALLIENALTTDDRH